MGARAHYSFKYKNQYINNVYQHWGAYDDEAIMIATRLFLNDFENMNEVVNFIVDNELLDTSYLYEKIKKYEGDSFSHAGEKEQFINRVKDTPNIFDSERKVIDYKETFKEEYLSDIPIHFDIIVAYFYDLDNKKLINAMNNKVLMSFNEERKFKRKF